MSMDVSWRQLTSHGGGWWDAGQQNEAQEVTLPVAVREYVVCLEHPLDLLVPGLCYISASVGSLAVRSALALVSII